MGKDEKKTGERGWGESERTEIGLLIRLARTVLSTKPLPLGCSVCLSHIGRGKDSKDLYAPKS